MTEKTIGQLPEATSVNDADLLEIEQDGVSKKATRSLVKGTSGSGDVEGPASAIDSHLAVFDGTTGKLIKDGGAVPTGSGPALWDKDTEYSAGAQVKSGGGIWEATGTNTNSRPTIQNTDWTLVYANGVIDLGIIRAADVMANGYLTIIPETAGLFVHRIFFSLDDYVLLQNAYVFYAPHVWKVGYGLGFLESSPIPGDTIRNIAQNYSETGEILESTPIVVAVSSSPGANLGAIRPWTANTKFAVTETRMASGKAWQVTTGGVSDASTEPDWTGSSPITDGTVTWTLLYPVDPDGQGHAWADAITVPGLEFQRPASLEFVQQPTDVVAGVAFDPVIRVRVLDQHGQPYLFYDNPVSDFSGLSIQLAVLGAGVFDVFGATWMQSVDHTTGIVTFSGLAMGATEAGTYKLVATTGSFAGIGIPLRLESSPFNVTAP